MGVVASGRRIYDAEFHDWAVRIMTESGKPIPEVVEDLVFRQPGFAVNAETGLQPWLLGYKVREIPISWINRTPGMGVSSFRLVRVGGGYWQVLFGLWLKRTFGTGPYRTLKRTARTPSSMPAAPIVRQAAGS